MIKAPIRLQDLRRSLYVKAKAEPLWRFWVDKKIRRHLMRARERKGFGWRRWSSDWFYNRLGLFNDYRLVRWPVVKAAPAR